jgi:transcriptional regulator with XRE-family HTH domain
LGEHLEAARLRASLTREEVAERLGVAEESVRRWERGGARPSADHLENLIALLAIDAVDLPNPKPAGEDLPLLARRLRHERAERGITQAQAAQKLGVAQPTYAGWEIGRATPATHFMPTVAHFLGLAERDLEDLIDTPFVVDTTHWPPLGQLLGSCREKLRMTRDELAVAMEVATGTVVAWELGYRTPRAQQLPRLATVLNVSVHRLEEALPKRELSALGELIRSRQQHLGLPRRDIAARAGLDEATLSRWANGHNTPKTSSLRRLADALEVSLQEIVRVTGGTGA